jgi:UDP-N-acetylglucosamine transferase subunit ALG13
LYESVLSSFTCAQVVDGVRANDRDLRIFVTLGTIRPYRFDALVDAVLATGLAGDSTVWQLGETTRDDLPGSVYNYMSSDEFDTSCADADVVITHAGVGTILALLEMGICPVVVPRRRDRHEHVDDHQLQISAHVAEAGVAIVRESGELKAEDVVSALSRRVAPLSAEPE